MSTAVLETEKMLSRLSRAEKAQILQWIVQDLGDVFPGIERQESPAGGVACVVRTRIPVWLLEQTRRLGATDADLLVAYPSLRAADLANAWAYVRTYSSEIDEAISENEAD
ncbi:DUF433 domain-containing protein [Spirosoma utsteinense]|uniref:DUF433 domain-containing protein n=1 Tax=Spirosoma utsteinense TaxID=2585773 RepID=A0ABR6W3P3_9BACT|nr:DUF433 domain-containing protein [Spirosoma utsteinense]MBC3784800.1 putative protein (DUF433 family) [Spirosoma utsteinense]MBC3791163.1 putative protein (DUF433 family) [Spirosoma utsteinense]